MQASFILIVLSWLKNINHNYFIQLVRYSALYIFSSKSMLKYVFYGEMIIKQES